MSGRRGHRFAHGPPAATLAPVLALALAGAPAAAQDAPPGPLVPAPPVPRDLPAPQAAADDPDAQRAAEATLRGPVVAVRVEPPLANENPWTRLGIAPGDAFDPARARSALQRALASGTFAEARLTAREVSGGVEVTVRGERRFLLRAVTLAGARARALDAVATDLGLHGGDYVTGSRVETGLGRIVRGYRDMGWQGAHAEADWRETDEPGARVLPVHITEGAPTRLAAVRLEGVPPDLAAAVGRALDLAPGDVADPAAAHRGADEALLVLRRAGHLRATMEPPEFVPAGDGRADLRLTMAAGERFRIAWEGVRRVPRDELADALRLEEERGLDAGTLTVLVGRVQDFYLRRAFLDVRVRGEITVEGGTGRGVVRFRVEEGAQVFVRSMRFPGAGHFTDDDLRDEVAGTLASELPANPLVSGLSVAQDDLLNGDSRGEVPHGRPGAPDYATFDRRRTYVPVVYTAAAQRVVQHYHEAGYLNAVVGTPTVERGRDAHGEPVLDVTFPVSEGARTLLDEVVFEGNQATTSAELAEASQVELGVPLSYRALEEARVRLAEHYRELAFAFVRVDPEVERSPDRTRARARFAIHEGPRVRVGAVRIRGAFQSSEAMIRERIALAEGGLYLLADVRRSQRHIAELGVFTGVSLVLDEPDVEAPVKTVLVQVTERRPQSLELRFGLSTGEGVRGGFEYGYWNLFGRAVSLSLRAQIGYLIQIPGITPAFPVEPAATDLIQYRLNSSLSFPFIPLLGPGFAATLDGTLLRTLTAPWFLTSTYGVALSVVNRSVQHLTLSLAGELQAADVKYFIAADRATFFANFVPSCMQAQGRTLEECQGQQQIFQQSLRLPDGQSLLASVRLGAALDLRDSAFSPTRGGYLSATGELLNVLNAAELQRQDPNLSSTTLHLAGRATGYVPLPLGVVFTTSLRGGVNIQLASGTQTHPTRLFLLGGADSMRGWPQNQLVAQDVSQRVATAPANEQSQILYTFPGGEVFVNWINDLRIPLGECFATNLCLALGLFVDAGNLWNVRSTFDPTVLRVSPGGGLRLTTPFGLVALDLGVNYWPRPWANEGPVAVQFSIGSI